MSNAIPTKNELLAAEREAFAAWQARLASVPPGPQRSHGWTVPEVVGHIAAWHNVSAYRLERLAAGELLDPPDATVFNDEVQEGVAGRREHAERAENEDARRAFLAAIEALPSEAIEAHDALGAFIIEANGAHHYQEHLANFATGDG